MEKNNTPQEATASEHQESNSSGIEPKIYVASLSDYVDGRLHGEWIDANQGVEELAHDVQAMLAQSPMAEAEEWAIHDYEGFGHFHLGEYESLDTVARIASGIAEHGQAFAHWISLRGTQDTEALDDFHDHYLGHWRSLGDYAESLLEDHGLEPRELGPPWLRPFIRIDYEALGQYLAADLETSDADGGVYVFTA